MAQVPYEFLVRWNYLTGELQGAHVKIYDNVSLKEGNAQTVAVAGASGFPLAAILTAIETGALIAMEQAIADKAAAEASLAAEKAAHDATKTALATKQAAII